MPNLVFHTQLMDRHLELSHSGAVKLSLELYFVSTKCKKGQSHAARSKEWVCCHLLAVMADSILTRGHGCLSLVNIVCCQVEVSAAGSSPVQRSPTKCGVHECLCEALRMGWPQPSRAVDP
jgi:hypothetical protein